MRARVGPSDHFPGQFGMPLPSVVCCPAVLIQAPRIDAIGGVALLPGLVDRSVMQLSLGSCRTASLSTNVSSCEASSKGDSHPCDQQFISDRVCMRFGKQSHTFRSVTHVKGSSILSSRGRIPLVSQGKQFLVGTLQ
jgi:hypothetical protein